MTIRSWDREAEQHITEARANGDHDGYIYLDLHSRGYTSSGINAHLSELVKQIEQLPRTQNNNSRYTAALFLALNMDPLDPRDDAIFEGIYDFVLLDCDTSGTAYNSDGLDYFRSEGSVLRLKELGSGKDSRVFSKDISDFSRRIAYKFTVNHEHEKKMHEQLIAGLGDRPPRAVIPKWYTLNDENYKQCEKEGLFDENTYLWRHTPVILLEIGHGKTLESILESKQSIEPMQMLKWTKDILYGLGELRAAGIIYHRDIRPGNIFLDEKADMAKIFDLGIATTSRRPQNAPNLRYGGPNDMVAVAQVLYKLAAKYNLFSESESMERTMYSEKIQIKDERDHVYQDLTGQLLKPYLKKVDDTIEHVQIRNTIKELLVAKDFQYKKMYHYLKKLTD